MAGEFQESLDAIAMAGIRLEELRERVVVNLRPGERPADVLGDVVIAEAHRVRVAERAVSHLGGGPSSDAGHRLESSPRRVPRQGGDAGKGVGDPAYPLDRV